MKLGVVEGTKILWTSTMTCSHCADLKHVIITPDPLFMHNSGFFLLVMLTVVAEVPTYHPTIISYYCLLLSVLI